MFDIDLQSRIPIYEQLYPDKKGGKIVQNDCSEQIQELTARVPAY